MTNFLRRREFITLVGGIAMAWPSAAGAQQAERVQRIGMLMSFPATDDYRLADSNNVQTSAAELVALMPDVLVVNGTSVLKAAQQATKTIPIVFVNVIDPIGQGFVQSLAHPGGNITGLSNVESEMGVKWLQLLKEIAPHVTQVAVVDATTLGGGAGIETAVRAAAPSLGVKLIPFTARIEAEIEHVINTLGVRPSLLGPQVFAERNNTGLLVLPGGNTRALRERIVALADRGRLPAIYPYRYYVTSGGLMSYGVDVADAYRRAAMYVDRILKGEKPADLPVQQATKFELIINVKTAKAFGLDVPATLLARADEVIE